MQKNIRRPFGLGLKAFFIILLMLLLWIPLLFIDNLVRERKNLQYQVVADIAKSTSGEQLINGPILVLPFRKTEREWKTLDDGTQVQHQYTVSGRRYFFPQTFDYRGSLATEQLRRGIYQARLYKNQGHISAAFHLPKQFGIRENFADYQFETAFLAIGIKDVRGINKAIEAHIDVPGQAKRPLQFEPGSNVSGLGGGIHAPLALLDANGSAQHFSVEVMLDLQGTSRFRISPTGRTTTVSLQSEWPHPSFFGDFLPLRREVGEQGFSAEWNTNFFATNMKERLLQHLQDCFQNSHSRNCENGYSGQSFGVDFIEPVDQYRKTDRAIKYGLLFIGLTFAVFFLFEVLKRLPVHPMQYTLVGFALALFYLLLLSLSEHIGFLAAYWVSSAACILLIGIYVSGVLASLQRGMILSGLLLALYAVLYGLLGAEEYALLIGSMMVFVLLAVVMLLTRKLNWYDFSRKEESGQ